MENIEKLISGVGLPIALVVVATWFLVFKWYPDMQAHRKRNQECFEKFDNTLIELNRESGIREMKLIACLEKNSESYEKLCAAQSGLSSAIGLLQDSLRASGVVL